MTALPTNTRRVMVERHHGWEGASPGLLGHVFGISTQQATAITNERCAACNLPICGHSDAQWSGHPASPTIIIDTASEPGSYDRYFRQCHGEPGQHVGVPA
jgi:hypothetical protein